MEYAALARGAKQSGGKIFFADEAHFQADAELRGKWVLRGEPALVDSTSPRYGEKASYYSAVCLETGEVDWMELEGNSNAGTSETFLRQLRERHLGPLSVIWDNAPAPLRLTQEWRGVEGVPSDAMSGAAAGEPPSTRGQALPGNRRNFFIERLSFGSIPACGVGRASVIVLAVAACIGPASVIVVNIPSRPRTGRRRCHRDQHCPTANRQLLIPDD